MTRRAATSCGGEPQAVYHGLDALRWVDASSPPQGAAAIEADGNLPTEQTAPATPPRAEL